MSEMKDQSRKSSRVLIKEIRNKNKDQVESLLLGGANVNGTDYDGNTPLHFAVESGDIEIVHLMIDHGANLNSTNNFGHRPYQIALDNNFMEALELLLSNENTVILNMGKSLRHLPHRIIELFYKRIDIRGRTPSGLTALHVATAKNDAYAVSQLLARGADVTAQSTYNQETALHLAVSRKVALILLNSGAQINTPDRYAVSPLSAVAVRIKKRLTRNDQSKIIELFVHRGAAVQEALVLGELHLDYNGGFDTMYGVKDLLKFMGLKEEELSFAGRINRGEFSLFYKQVLAEVDKMKDTTFYCNNSFFQFLVKSWQGRLNYVDDVRIAKAAVGVIGDLAAWFPLYCPILKRHVDAAIKRHRFRQNAADALEMACPTLGSLHVVLNKILMCLTKNDMRNIVTACEKF